MRYLLYVFNIYNFIVINLWLIYNVHDIYIKMKKNVNIYLIIYLKYLNYHIMVICFIFISNRHMSFIISFYRVLVLQRAEFK